MKKSGSNLWNIKSGGILLLTVIFLVFGFCPLRNTLSALVRQVPQTTAPKAPEYAKIIAHDDCNSAVVDKVIPASEKIQVPPVLLAWLPENDHSVDRQPFIIIAHCLLQPPTVVAVPKRIYLLNRSLLI